jgi:hypothetical protein
MKTISTSLLAVLVTVTLIGGSIGIQTVAAGPALTPFNFKVKECKVDTSPDPVSCKSVKKLLQDLDTEGFTLELTIDREAGATAAILYASMHNN